MEKSLDTERILQATRALILNTFVNKYAVERVALGFEKPGDKAPIDLYLKHLRLEINDESMRKNIPGAYIDEQECIKTEQGYAAFVRDLFVSQIEHIFYDAVLSAPKHSVDEDIPLPPRFRNYLFGLLPLFTEILNVKVEHTVFDVIPTDGAARATEYPKWKKFVTAILLKPIKSGSRINRYVNNFTCAPQYVCRLIEKKGYDFYLKPVDIADTEYVLALFSLMQFMNDENRKLFELKMLEWERRRN